MGGGAVTWPPRAAVLVVLLVTSASLAGASRALAQDAATPDPRPERGALVAFAATPDVGPTERACSFRHPVCVQAPSGASPSKRGHALAVLAAADRAWDVLTGALALPAPDTDVDGALAIYLADGVPGGGGALLQGRDPRARFDRGTAFGVVDGSLGPGCGLDLALARALAEAMLLRAVPATDAGTRRAEVESLARQATPCAASSEATLDDTLAFQTHPEQTLVDPSSPAFDRGASLFFDWLDATFAREPGGLVGALWALAPTQTPPGAPRWRSSPTGFDVLGASLRGGGDGSAAAALEDLFVRFALKRPFEEPPARAAWHVGWPAPARRLASPVPVSPSGASYVVVDHAGAPPGAKLRVEAEWEDYGRMRWVVMKVDAAGHPSATLPVTSLDRATRGSLTVESLDGVDRVLLVGVNVGSTEHPFDPGQGEWEPHGWLLTLEGQ